VDKVKVPAKSTLQRYAHWAPAEVLNDLIAGILRQAHQDPKSLQLAKPVDLDSCIATIKTFQ
jgi:hypothetical protein